MVANDLKSTSFYQYPDNIPLFSKNMTDVIDDLISIVGNLTAASNRIQYDNSDASSSYVEAGEFGVTFGLSPARELRLADTAGAYRILQLAADGKRIDFLGVIYDLNGNLILDLNTRLFYSQNLTPRIGITNRSVQLNIPAYANNAAALSGGLILGDLYYTDVAGEWIIKITH